MRHQICLALIVKHARASKNFQRKSHMLFENIYLVETLGCKGGKHINWAQFVCGWGAQTWQRVGRVRSLLAETRTHKGLRLQLQRLGHPSLDCNPNEVTCVNNTYIYMYVSIYVWYTTRCPMGFGNVQKMVNRWLSQKGHQWATILRFVPTSWLRSIHFVHYKYKMRGKYIWNLWVRIKWEGNIWMLIKWEAKLANPNRTPLMELNL